MQKILILILIQLSVLASLHALDDTKKVKSELLKAIHYSDTQEVKAITKREQRVLASDPILQKMVDAYFDKEKRALEELKAEIRAKKEADKKAKENARIAAFLAEVARKEALNENNTTIPSEVAQKNRTKESVPLTKKVVTSKVPTVKPTNPVTNKSTVVKKELKQAPVKNKTTKEPVKKYSSTSKPASKIVYREKTHRYLNKNGLSGEWKQHKKEKTIVFEMFADQAFVLTERSESGILKLEGHYKQKDDNLLLDITKITYNVRSRAAAVQRVYKFKTISATKLVLLDEAGRVVYTLKR